MVYGFAALAIFQAWGFGSLEWLTTPVGRRVGGSLVSIGVTVIAALFLWEFVNALLDRYLARALGGGLDELRRAARVRTLMPLLQNIMLGVLGVFVVMVVLSEIGVNIAPLLAGAGVVGIAVGFGAQTLAKDLISGISVILEDSIAVGDVVQARRQVRRRRMDVAALPAPARRHRHRALDPVRRRADRLQHDQGLLLCDLRSQRQLRAPMPTRS